MNIRMAPLLSAALVAGTAFRLAAVENWSVSTVPELTDALSRSSAGDTITLAKGVYELKDVVTGNDAHLNFPHRLVLRGDPSLDRGEVVLDGGLDGHRTIFFANADANGSLVANLTIRNSKNADGGAYYTAYRNGDATLWGSFSNCVFRGNQANDGGCGRGGTLTDCLFEGNQSTTGYGAAVYYQAKLVRCTFRGNTSKTYATLYNGCTAYDCTFDSNTNLNGKAIDMYGGRACGCTFTGTPYGGYSCQDMSVVSNCTFAGFTVMPSSRFVSMAPEGTPILDSRFRDNPTDGTRIYTHPLIGCTVESSARDCTMSNCTLRTLTDPALFERLNLVDCTVESPMTDGVLTRCTVRNIHDTRAIFAESAVLTNCLIVNNGNAKSCTMFYTDKTTKGGHLVNCTVVSNSAQIFRGTVDSSAINTVFFGNTYDDGKTGCDISCDNYNFPSLTNCVFQTVGTKPVRESNRVNCLQLGSNDTPRFNMGRYPDYPAFMPRRSSKLVDRGSEEVVWPADATDMSGRGRINRLRVDVGAFENWYSEGLSVIVR